MMISFHVFHRVLYFVDASSGSVRSRASGLQPLLSRDHHQDRLKTTTAREQLSEGSSGTVLIFQHCRKTPDYWIFGTPSIPSLFFHLRAIAARKFFVQDEACPVSWLEERVCVGGGFARQIELLYESYLICEEWRNWCSRGFSLLRDVGWRGLVWIIGFWWNAPTRRWRLSWKMVRSSFI